MPITFQDAFSSQFHAFHGAIIDDCDRASGPDRSDGMVLRLRNNALGLAKMQLAMLAFTSTPSPAPEPEPEPAPLIDPWPDPESAEPLGPGAERILSGDALSRFVSRPLRVDESAHKVWLDELGADPAKRRRNPEIPRAGFLSPPS